MIFDSICAAAVIERSAESLKHTNLKVVKARATGLDPDSKTVKLSNSKTVAYDRLCISAGAAPKVTGSSFFLQRVCSR